jgi:hypothetical protein
MLGLDGMDGKLASAFPDFKVRNEVFKHIGQNGHGYTHKCGCTLKRQAPGRTPCRCYNEGPYPVALQLEDLMASPLQSHDPLVVRLRRFSKALHASKGSLPLLCRKVSHQKVGHKTTRVYGRVRRQCSCTRMQQFVRICSPVLNTETRPLVFRKSAWRRERRKMYNRKQAIRCCRQ